VADFLAPTAKTSGEGSVGPATQPEEADIWKTAGTTVYYFNQLRGRQVIDLADPANPRLVATLRLPAVVWDDVVGSSLPEVLIRG
jgi:hypothetical protein